MAVFTIRIEAERERFPVLLANGNRIDAGDLPSGRHYAVWHDPSPKPAYLFAMVAGDLGCVEARFVTRSGPDVALRLYGDRRNEGRPRPAPGAVKRPQRVD